MLPLTVKLQTFSLRGRLEFGMTISWFVIFLSTIDMSKEM